jgi:uncharacterized Zn-binding protein involved in type VI secretion
MPSVAINPPKTPVTEGSLTIAAATIPNVCKMPGPPAPFVPTPLPNIAKSDLSPKNYSKKVKIEGKAVAIRGATFESLGDIASKGTGGGLVSSNTQGPAKFITPGSLTVKIEGKGVHLLGEPMLNNCGPSGNPPNTGATMTGAVHAPLPVVGELLDIKCSDAPASSDKKFSECEKEEICAKCEDVNRQAKAGKLKRRSGTAYEIDRADGDYKCAQLNKAARSGKRDLIPFTPVKSEKCRKELKDKAEATNYGSVSADHIHEIQLGGHPGHPTASSNLRWMTRKANEWMGTTLKQYDPSKHSGVKPDCCD